MAGFTAIALSVLSLVSSQSADQVVTSPSVRSTADWAKSYQSLTSQDSRCPARLPGWPAWVKLRSPISLRCTIDTSTDAASYRIAYILKLPSRRAVASVWVGKR